MAGIEVGIAADETIAVVAVVGVVARSAQSLRQKPAGRQVDFLVRVAAVHVVGHHVVEHLHPGTAERAGGLAQLGIAAIAAVLAEIVPEVAFAAAGLAAVAPAGEVTPGTGIQIAEKPSAAIVEACWRRMLYQSLGASRTTFQWKPGG